MASANPVTLWRRFLETPNDRLSKTLAVALLVGLVSAFGVSVAAVTLRPMQEANLDRERQVRMAEMVAALPGIGEILEDTGAGSLETHLVDLDSGAFVADVDPATFDQRAAASDPEQSMELSADADIAGIGRRANYAPVYFVNRGDERSLIILPVHGAGYQSTLYGYLALEGDGNTVAALTFYEQGDTPGLGARVLDEAWQDLWPGKSVADESGAVRITVVRGEASGPYEVDGISGATRTSTGVTNLLHFWLGDDGFGPFLSRLRSGEL